MQHILAQITVNATDLGLPTGTTTVSGGVTNVINLLYSLLGGLAILALIYGGIQLALSEGDPGKVKTARSTIQYAVIGIVLAMSSYIIIWFITHNIGSTNS